MCWLGVCIAGAAEPRFELRFERTVRGTPFTGRVYLFTSTNPAREPRIGPDWFHPEPFVALDVRDWAPETPLAIAAGQPGLLGFPESAVRLDWAGRSVQAVARFNPVEREVGRGAGNGASSAVVLPAGGSGLPLVLPLTRLIPAPTFRETAFSRLLEVPSARLAQFHGRPVVLRASISLPGSYATEPDRRYPVIFTIPGFGGTHGTGGLTQPARVRNRLGVEFIHVLLDPSCPLGHHVFADSANTGPVGTALIEELIPALDRRFRTVATSGGRFLTGHSSGGWSSLWVQITWPSVFGGTWSTAPDPVDFRDFQRINLYEPGVNMYRDAAGVRRPLARRGTQVALWYDDFARMESVLGPGGQLHSFEAVFSPRGNDGRPRRLWNWETGSVDPDVARTWAAYDIRLVLERNWKTLGPKLAGKLHVFMGTLDTFYLEGATALLKASLERLGSDAVVELIPDRNHSTLLDEALRNRIEQEMAEAYRARTGGR